MKTDMQAENKYSELKYWLPLLPIAAVLLMPLWLGAQTSGNGTIQKQLLADPDVTWVSEFYDDYRFNPMPSKENWWNDLHIFKWANKESQNGFTRFVDGSLPVWSWMMFDWIENAKMPAYEDARLAQPIAKDEVYHRFMSGYHRLDTVADSSSDGMYLEGVSVSSDAIKGVRVRWLLYFSKKDNGLHARAISYGPMVVKYNKDFTAFDYDEPVIWFAVEQAPSFDVLYDEERITYIVQVKSGDTAPKLNGLQSLKGQFDFKSYFESCIESKDKQLFSTEGDFGVLGAEDLDMFSGRVDTLITIDGTTFEETVEVVETPPALDELRSIVVVSNWFFDEKNGKVYFQPVGFAPTYAIKGENGKDKYWRKLFYMRE